MFLHDVIFVLVVTNIVEVNMSDEPCVGPCHKKRTCYYKSSNSLCKDRCCGTASFSCLESCTGMRCLSDIDCDGECCMVGANLTKICGQCMVTQEPDTRITPKKKSSTNVSKAIYLLIVVPMMGFVLLGTVMYCCYRRRENNHDENSRRQQTIDLGRGPRALNNHGYSG